MENTKAEVREKIKEAQKVLIGIGKEWALRDDEKDIRFRHFRFLLCSRLFLKEY